MLDQTEGLEDCIGEEAKEKLVYLVFTGIYSALCLAAGTQVARVVLFTSQRSKRGKSSGSRPSAVDSGSPGGILGCSLARGCVPSPQVRVSVYQSN